MRVICKDCDVVMKMYKQNKTRYECPKCDIYIAIYLEGDEE